MRSIRVHGRYERRLADTAGQPPGEDRTALARITGRCDELATVRSMVREFADMLCNRTGRKLPGWAHQAEAN